MKKYLLRVGVSCSPTASCSWRAQTDTSIPKHLTQRPNACTALTLRACERATGPATSPPRYSRGRNTNNGSRTSSESFKIPLREVYFPRLDNNPAAPQVRQVVGLRHLKKDPPRVIIHDGPWKRKWHKVKKNVIVQRKDYATCQHGSCSGIDTFATLGNFQVSYSYQEPDVALTPMPCALHFCCVYARTVFIT